APVPLPMLFAPSAVARLPLAFAFVPQPKDDDAGADAPLLLAVTELTTDVFVGVTSVRTCPNPTLRLLTTALGEVAVPGSKVTPVAALANVGAVAPGVKVKKLFAVGAARFVPLVKNPAVEVTLVTTGCGDASVPAILRWCVNGCLEWQRIGCPWTGC